MSRRTLAGSRAIVTGASSGIGRELARELNRSGVDLLLTARRRERLQELAAELTSHGPKAAYVAGDITSASVRADVLQAAERELGGLDMLVNNAGVGALGLFVEANETRLRRVMEVNFFAPLELIRGAIPLLRAGMQPLIVNVSSVLGHRAVPRKSEYCASKFAIHGFSDALRAELAPQGVDVLLVSPSTTDSEFFDQVLEDEGPPARLGHYAMPASVVARKTVRAMRLGRHEIILSTGGKLLVWLDRLCPPLANRIIARFG